MDLLEETAAQAEGNPCVAVRARLAQRYRSAIGVGPEHREAFRSGLGRIETEGCMPPADLAQLISWDNHKKGSAPAADSRFTS